MKNYEFHVGDYVETVNGEIGYIDYICECDNCKRRKFFEPHVHFADNNNDYITFADRDNGFKCFKRIGRNEINTKLEKKNKIEPLICKPKIEKKIGYVCRINAEDYPNDKVKPKQELVDIITGVEYPSNEEVINKLNEVINYINKE